MIKVAVKETVGAFSFIFGLIELYDIANDCFSGTELKVMQLVTRISLVIGGFVSPLGRRLIAWILPSEIIQFFGPARVFAANSYQLRHVLSIASFLLGIPATLKTLFCEQNDWREKMAAFNTLTHRVAQHTVNQVFFPQILGTSL